MPNRWIILFVLFVARTTMAFQFQSVAALSPFIIDNLALSLVEIGFLIGLYLGPGIIVATLGGTVAALFGDKRTVLASIFLMVAGSAMIALSPSVTWFVAGRVVSGIGGVVVNVVMTKMVIDWFAGRNVSTALSIFISSWPFGIALGLLVLPGLAAAGGLDLAWAVMTATTLLSLVLFAVIYQSPPDASGQVATVKVSSLPWSPLVYAAVLWGLYNTAFAMVFGFGTLVLQGRGLGAAQASSLVSLYMLTAMIAIPAGGWIADKSGRRDMVILVSLVAGVLLFPAVLYLPVGSVGWTLALAGLVVGLAPGPIVSLPAAVLPLHARAFGTGIFYSIYYLLMLIAPPIAGGLSDLTGSVNTSFLLGTAMMVGCIFALEFYRRTAKAPVEQD